MPHLSTNKRRRTGRKPQEYYVQAEYEMNPEESERRRLRRERNKEAAARCRQRRLDQMDELQKQIEFLESELFQKSMAIESLKEENEDLRKVFKSSNMDIPRLNVPSQCSVQTDTIGGVGGQAHHLQMHQNTIPNHPTAEAATNMASFPKKHANNNNNNKRKPTLTKRKTPTIQHKQYAQTGPDQIVHEDLYVNNNCTNLNQFRHLSDHCDTILRPNSLNFADNDHNDQNGSRRRTMKDQEQTLNQQNVVAGITIDTPTSGFEFQGISTGLTPVTSVAAGFTPTVSCQSLMSIETPTLIKL